MWWSSRKLVTSMNAIETLHLFLDTAFALYIIITSSHLNVPRPTLTCVGCLRKSSVTSTNFMSTLHLFLDIVVPLYIIITSSCLHVPSYIIFPLPFKVPYVLVPSCIVAIVPVVTHSDAFDVPSLDPKAIAYTIFRAHVPSNAPSCQEHRFGCYSQSRSLLRLKVPLCHVHWLTVICSGEERHRGETVSQHLQSGSKFRTLSIEPEAGEVCY
jgi:hypothetical protein